MPTLITRNVSEAVLTALRLRAAGAGRSVEGEVREIIEAAVLPVQRLQVGTALVHVGLVAGGISLHPEHGEPEVMKPE